MRANLHKLTGICGALQVWVSLSYHGWKKKCLKGNNVNVVEWQLQRTDLSLIENMLAKLKKVFELDC